MKKLLNKTVSIFAIYSLIVLAASIPAYYYLTDGIWLRELDEHNEIIADRTTIELNKLQLTNTALTQSIILWNKIQPGTNLKKLDKYNPKPDSVYTYLKKNFNTENKSLDRFRGLSRHIKINGYPYLLIVETNVEESGETAVAIAALTFLFFTILVVGFLLLNRWLSAQLWKPFRNTLSKLKTFNLSNQTRIEFKKSDTLEFEELNEALQKLIEQNISVYKTQKEFTENASHELQTPLAIIKNKLDLLLQKETLTDRQYHIIEEINRALLRITRINKNLLLLSKIENRQFDTNEIINISQITQQCFEHLIEHLDNKDITAQTQTDNNVMVEGNKTLIEILINNLLLNAIRHNQQNGTITIFLSKKELEVSNSGNTSLNCSTLFNRFAKTSNESVGSGLGLSIIEQICNRHAWTIHYKFKDSFHIFSIQF